MGLPKTAIRVSVGEKTSTVTHVRKVQAQEICGALNARLLGARILTTGSARVPVADPGSQGRLADYFTSKTSLPSVLLLLQVVAFVLALALEYLGGFGKGAVVTTPSPQQRTQQATAVLYLLVILLGHSLLRRAFLAIVSLRLTVQVLMFIVLIGAVALGDFQEAATVALSVNAAEWLTGRVHSAVEAAISGSFVDSPTHATRLPSGGGPAESVPIAEFMPGDRMLVQTGEVVPVDGVVQKADNFKVDEASVTGEALPVPKNRGSKILSGTVVVAGQAEVECSARAEDSFQGRMKRAVEEARSLRSDIEETVNLIAKGYTPLVVLGSFLVAVFTRDPIRGLAALVGACPCALVAAAPVVQACTLVKLLTDQQVLVKSARALETLGRIQSLAVDKTGTLTQGSFALTDACVLSGLKGTNKEELLRLLASVEAKDPHPLANCIVAASVGCVAEAASKGAVLPEVLQFKRVDGMGVWGVVEGQVVGAGNAEFVDHMCIDMPDDADAIRKQWEAEGGAFTTVYMILEEEVAMILKLQDSLRPDAEAALALLRGGNHVRAALLTGDAERPANMVAKQLGIREVFAGMKPQDKARWVKNRQAKPLTADADIMERGAAADLGVPLLAQEGPGAKRQQQVVGMLGDGLNDAPALAAADVGIAVSCGLQLTLDTADVVARKGGPLLLHVAQAVERARRCRRLILQNLGIAMGVKIATICLAASGKLTLSLGVLSDVGSLLLVVANSLRPLYWSTA